MEDTIYVSSLERSLGKRVEVTLTKIFERFEDSAFAWYSGIVKGKLIDFILDDENYYRNRIFVMDRNNKIVSIKFSKIKSLSLA